MNLPWRRTDSPSGSESTHGEQVRFEVAVSIEEIDGEFYAHASPLGVHTSGSTAEEALNELQIGVEGYLDTLTNEGLLLEVFEQKGVRYEYVQPAVPKRMPLIVMPLLSSLTGDPKWVPAEASTLQVV